MGLKPYEQSQGAGRRFPGQMLLNPKSKLKQYFMSYKEGRTLIRPWGEMLPTGEMVPWRDNQGNFGVSWFVQDTIAQAWGKDFKFTAFMRVEDEQAWPAGSPLQLLYDEVRYAPQYKSLLERVGQSWAIIGQPRHVGFLKGLLIECNGKNYANRPIWGTLLVLPPSAREALDNLLNQQAAGDVKAEASEADPYGHNTKYYVGDPIGINCGKIFEFDKESKITGKSADAADINLDGDGSKGGKDDKKEIESYGCRIFPSKKVLPLASKIDMVKKTDESFTDSFWFMTGAEQIENLIIRAFGHSHRDLILYVFGNKGVLPKAFESARTTVPMGGQPSTGRPSAPPAEENVEINLDAGGDPEEGGPPWDDSQHAAGPERSAAGPVFTPAPQGAPAAAPAAAPVATGGTTDSIRARLAAAKAQQAQAQ